LDVGIKLELANAVALRILFGYENTFSKVPNFGKD
jgi:hypothetical protein